MKLKKLYITDNINSLESLAQRDDVIQSLKKTHRFSNFVNKMMAELLQCQDDQEKCYILCRRYINLMDHLFKISDDQNYIRALHSSDYRKVKLLINEIRESLEERYKRLAVENENKKIEVPPPLTQNIEATIMQKRFNFKDIFIYPGDLFMLLQTEDNFLIVDIRPAADFMRTKINPIKGEIINIPGELIVPGLSANTLGQRLDAQAKQIWDKRNTFDIIVLLDEATVKYDYIGSVLARLRSIIVEWDTRMQYPEEPVILNGGLKEFVEWYPTAVDNSRVFLHQTNSEIDELLDLDSISYPESGAPRQMNLKMHSTSKPDLEQVKSDFDEESEISSTVFEDTLSDFYQDPVLHDDSGLEVMPEAPSTEDIGKAAPSSIAIDEAAVKEMVEGDKAAQLLKARQAAKPRLPEDEAQESRDEIARGRSLQREEDTEGSDFRDRSPFIKPPSVDRSFKPIPVTGEGFTGLRNIKNICYMNCLLQCLKVIPSIKASYVTSDRYLSYTTRKPPKINYHLAAVLREIWGGTAQRHKIFLISHFKERICEFAPIYDKNTHEDCFEFFLFLFNAVSEDCSMDIPRQVMTESEKAWYGHLQGRSSFWIDQFYFQMKNMKVCLMCHKINPSFDTEGMLLLPVPNKECSLQELIEEYLQENKLLDYSCSNCKSTGTIANRKELTVEPEILAVVLKRYFSAGDRFCKNEVEVDFPLHDLEFGSSRYSCYSVVQHSGGMTHGHYYATVKLDDKNEQWYQFNDEAIVRQTRAINESSYTRSTAAGFFYVRQEK